MIQRENGVPTDIILSLGLMPKCIYVYVAGEK